MHAISHWLTDRLVPPISRTSRSNIAVFYNRAAMMASAGDLIRIKTSGLVVLHYGAPAAPSPSPPR